MHLLVSHLQQSQKKDDLATSPKGVSRLKSEKIGHRRVKEGVITYKKVSSQGTLKVVDLSH